MEQFKKITVEDREILAKYINMRKHRACDYSVGNLVLWSDIYNTQFAVANDMLFIKFRNGDKNYFAFPMGNGNLKQSFQWIFEYLSLIHISEPTRLGMISYAVFCLKKKNKKKKNIK